MKRILAPFFALLFLTALAVPAFAAGSLEGMSGKSVSLTPTKTCPAGQTFVKGYTKKGGNAVKGYCRVAKTASKKTK